MTGIPALTIREVRLGLADKDKGRHWPRGRCWCETEHDSGEAGLTIVAPPWDESRDGENA